MFKNNKSADDDHEYSKFNDPKGQSMKSMMDKVEKQKAEESKLINPKFIFDKTKKFNKLKNGSKYKAPKPPDVKPKKNNISFD